MQIPAINKLMSIFIGWNIFYQLGVFSAESSTSFNLFAADLIPYVALNRSAENVIYSPASIDVCLAMAFFAAGGTTAQQIRAALHLGTNTSDNAIAASYKAFLSNTFNAKTVSGVEPPILSMANRIYSSQSFGAISQQFNQLASNDFGSTAEEVNFANAAAAVASINSWVANQTNDKIQNLLSAAAVNKNTSAVLVNAIYFKGAWQTPFDKELTHKAEFSIDASQQVLVDMMQMQAAQIKYVQLPHYNAVAIELPYNNSDISMMIILPNDIGGLRSLLQNLASTNLNQLSAQMQWKTVNVFLPKFQIEFAINLQKTLSELGMSSMFTDYANFSKLLASGRSQKITGVFHKAFLEVNEAGSEAAAATGIVFGIDSIVFEAEEFNANRPFAFAIRNKNAVLFAGHVSTF